MKQKIRYKKNYSFKHRKLHKVKYPWLYLTREEFKKLIVTNCENTLNKTKEYFKNSKSVYNNEQLLDISKHIFSAIKESIPKKYLLNIENELIRLILEFLKTMELSPEKDKENSLIILMNSLNIKE